MEVRCEPVTRPCNPRPLGVIGQGFDVARQGVVAFIAVHVDHQAALGGKLAQGRHRRGAVGHGALEVRDAAHHVDTHVERPDHGLPVGRQPEIAVLGKSYQLQVEVGLELLTDVQQGVDGQHLRVAHVDMAADGERAAGDGPLAQLAGAGLDGFDGQLRFQLPPELDPLQQRAAAVHARLAVAQGRVHVKMAVDERRCHQAPGGIDFSAGCGLDRRRQLFDATVLNRDVVSPPAIRQVGVADNEVQHQRASLRKGLSRAAGASALRETRAIPTMVSTNGSIRNTW